MALVLLTELNACIPTAAVNLNLPRPEPARRVSALGPDPLRVNRPKVPFALEPLQWGTVSPRGWLLEWATALSHGSGSPKCSAFATTKPDGHSVDGWRGGRPSFGGFWDEDSAYYIDGLTRLGLVLQDDILLSRVKEDYEWVMAHPDNFNATYRGDIVEGWIRSIYSRGMLAYYDGTGDKRVLSFLNEQLGKYDPRTSTYASDQTRQGSRSMTQMEALLETYAYGGDVKLVETALQLMSPIAKNDGYRFMQELLAPGCVALEPAAINATSGVADEGGCVNHAHGVTYNEVSKLFAMGYSYSANRSHLQASLTAYELVDKFDMQVYGVNSGDEDMNGIGPNAATETCDVSDFIYSNSWMLRVTGRSKFGDHLERAFYNAAPGAVSSIVKYCVVEIRSVVTWCFCRNVGGMISCTHAG